MGKDGGDVYEILLGAFVGNGCSVSKHKCNSSADLAGILLILQTPYALAATVVKQSDLDRQSSTSIEEPVIGMTCSALAERDLTRVLDTQTF